MCRIVPNFYMSFTSYSKESYTLITVCSHSTVQHSIVVLVPLTYLQPYFDAGSTSCNITLYEYSPLNYFHETNCFVPFASSYFVSSQLPS